MTIEIDLTGKNAIVTGGTRGIGRSISLRLAQAGARVGMLFRGDESAAQEAVAQLDAVSGIGHFALQGDLSDRNQASDAANKAVARFDGLLDIVVLNAGIGTRGAPFSELTFEEWQQPFDVNVNGHVAVLQTVSPALRPSASVIFISSGAGHDPLENLSAYGASKAAVNHLATVLAQEWGPRGIRVNIISPGSTAKSAVDYENLTEGQKQTISATALRRLGTADDIADVALFYASDLSSFVTGQWLRVNGGRV
jgi:3-oxoacyl-[acyl-carrier protein] reductase